MTLFYDYQQAALGRVRRERVFVGLWFGTLGAACLMFPLLTPLWVFTWIVFGAGYLGNIIR